jgi:hypothetical protein
MLRDVLEGVDLEPLLARGGLGPAEVAALRSRLLS